MRNIFKGFLPALKGVVRRIAPFDIIRERKPQKVSKEKPKMSVRLKAFMAYAHELIRSNESQKGYFHDLHKALAKYGIDINKIPDRLAGGKCIFCGDADYKVRLLWCRPCHTTGLHDGSIRPVRNRK